MSGMVQIHKCIKNTGLNLNINPNCANLLDAALVTGGVNDACTKIHSNSKYEKLSFEEVQAESPPTQVLLGLTLFLLQWTM